VKSSLQKDFAIAFYRYRMWLDEQQVAGSRKGILLRHTNHFLAYLTFSSTDFRAALQRPEILQKALRSYMRFLRSSLNYSSRDIAVTIRSIQQFCDFTEISRTTSKQAKAWLTGSQPKITKDQGLRNLSLVRVRDSS